MMEKTHCAFFSYSRDDSEFALKLAKDLKAQRAVVWLDQLDISPGQHWDTALEEALDSCPNMLLVLSPSSVASQNVMDEVSFAIEEHKLVIPILYRTCKIPLRLRRLQYIDARTDYDSAFNELRRLLSPDEDAKAERETRLEKQRAHIEGEQDPPAQDKEQAQRDEAKRVAEVQAAQEQQARNRAAAQRAPDSQRPTSIPAGNSRQQTGKLWLAGAAIVLVVIIGVIWREATAGSPARSNSPPYQPPTTVDTGPPGKSTDTAATQTSEPLTSPSEPAKQPVPSTAEWAQRFVGALASSSVTTLHPFFDETVSPYYSMQSADWDAIVKDKQSFFRTYPTVQYTIVGQPREISESDDHAVVELDMKYDVVRKDGQRREGNSHLSMDLHLVNGDWKVAGIHEIVSGK